LPEPQLDRTEIPESGAEFALSEYPRRACTLSVSISPLDGVAIAGGALLRMIHRNILHFGLVEAWKHTMGSVAGRALKSLKYRTVMTLRLSVNVLASNHAVASEPLNPAGPASR
jgi:hypothetical protein